MSTYRAGGGSEGNVAPDTITKLDPSADRSLSFVTAVTNPFAATGGADEEPDQQVRACAPQAFRAVQYRAVTARRLPESGRNAALGRASRHHFRWTGSWLTIFTTADPKGTEQITVDQQIGLMNLLNRYRWPDTSLTCRLPVYVAASIYRHGLRMPGRRFAETCGGACFRAQHDLFANGATGFFYLDRFTFGTPLERSALEAAIQLPYGVAGVVSIQYRRARCDSHLDLPAGRFCKLGHDQILRMDNDPSCPERGTFQVVVEGGK